MKRSEMGVSLKDLEPIKAYFRDAANPQLRALKVKKRPEDPEWTPPNHPPTSVPTAETNTAPPSADQP